MALIKRLNKGSHLTYQELDGNFTHLGGDGTYQFPDTAANSAGYVLMSSNGGQLEWSEHAGLTLDQINEHLANNAVDLTVANVSISNSHIFNSNINDVTITDSSVSNVSGTDSSFDTSSFDNGTINNASITDCNEFTMATNSVLHANEFTADKVRIIGSLIETIRANTDTGDIASNSTDLVISTGIQSSQAPYSNVHLKWRTVGGGSQERLEVTEDGIHIGSDITGTYTAGDMAQNFDTGFGMAVGGGIANYGYTNALFGLQHTAGANTVANFITGFGNECAGNTDFSVIHGVRNLIDPGTGILPDAVFLSGEVSQATGYGTFTHAEGSIDWPGGGIRTYATNAGRFAVMFGEGSQTTNTASYSFNGGQIKETYPGGEVTDFNKPTQSGAGCFNWGASSVANDCIDSTSFGNMNTVQNGEAQFAAGQYNTVHGEFSSAIGANNSVGQTTGGGVTITSQFAVGTNLASQDETFAAGQASNTGTVYLGAFNKKNEKHLIPGGTSWVTDYRLVVGSGESSGDPLDDNHTYQNALIIAVETDDFCGIIAPALYRSPAYANNTVASSNGVPLGGLYRTSSGDVKIRTS